MNFFLSRCTFVPCLLIPCLSSASDIVTPTTVFWDGAHMATIKAELPRSQAVFAADLQRLRRAATAAVNSGPYSVMDKQEAAPSRDKHDYLSFSRYWWPDPQQPDGLPYIRHDGRVNRQLVERGDRTRLGALCQDIVPLAMASYFFADELSAAQARRLLRVWFLDEATRMNPNLNYAQAVPGRTSGRGVGIIDSRGFIWLLDSVELLRVSGGLSESEVAELRLWFSEFLAWLQTSPLADEERQAENNHGSWYAAQVARIALFVERRDVAEEIVRDVLQHRLRRQIAQDGRQPCELERTQGLHYSLFNLAALTIVARVGEQLEMDLWNSQLASAVDYLAPFACGDRPWPHQQISKVRLSLSEAAALALLADRCRSAAARRVSTCVKVKYDELDFTRLQFPR